MLLSNDDVRGTVEQTLLEFGRQVLVEKSISAPLDSVYADAELTYAAGVPVLAHVAYGKITEKVWAEQLPESLVYDGSLTFASSLLCAALSVASPFDALTLSDVLTFDARTWRICHIAYTGELRGETMVVWVFFMGKPGEML